MGLNDLEQSLEGSEGVDHDVYGKSISGRGNGQYRSPGLRVCLVCWRKKKLLLSFTLTPICGTGVELGWRKAVAVSRKGRGEGKSFRARMATARPCRKVSLRLWSRGGEESKFYLIKASLCLQQNCLLFCLRIEGEWSRGSQGRGEAWPVSGSLLKVDPIGCPNEFSHYLWELSKFSREGHVSPLLPVNILNTFSKRQRIFFASWDHFYEDEQCRTDTLDCWSSSLMSWASQGRYEVYVAIDLQPPPPPGSCVVCVASIQEGVIAKSRVLKPNCLGSNPNN